MERRMLILLLFFAPVLSIAQSEKLSINNHEFEIRTEVAENDWETMDTLQTLYRIEEGNPKYVLKFYQFQDRGGDCNNLFWNRETMEVIGDNMIFTTHYYQKTGIDPIPEWRKQIYAINIEGKLILKSDKYKYYNSTEWVEQ